MEGIHHAQKPNGLGVRHVQYFMMWLGIMICFGMRTNMNVAVVAMVAETRKDQDFPTYPEWRASKNVILSSFFCGYLVLQVPAGQIAKKYGPKLFLFSAVSITSGLCALLPVFAEHLGLYGVIAIRIMQGLTQGFLFPSCQHLMGRWVAPIERGRWGALIFSGSPLGNVISTVATGLLCASKLGWPAIFYLYGFLGIAWALLYLYFGANSPSDHKSISTEEMKFLEVKEHEDEKISTPWLAIFTSPPLLAIILSHIGQNWGFYTLLMEIPTYMENILHFNIKQNSMLSALPYFVMWIIATIISPIADYITNKGLTSVTTARKIFNTIGLGALAATLITLSLVDADRKEIVVLILVIGVGLNAFQYSGYCINHIDLSPVHAGTLMGITNCIANISSISAPLVVDVVKAASGYTETDLALWNIVFCLAAGILIFVSTIFVIFGSGEVQQWNYWTTGRSRDGAYRESIPAKSLSPSTQKLSLSWMG